MATSVSGPRRRSMQQNERLLGWLLLTPAFTLLAMIVVYPVAALIWTSFHRVDQSIGQGVAPFVGLENYIDAFKDDHFWSATFNTFLYIIITVPGALLVGLGIALLANLPFRVKWPVRLGLLLPWALPVVFAGLIFRWFFEYEQGIVNDIIRRLGATPPQWLSSPNLAFFAICITIIWKTSSFVALVLLAGLQTIPKELYEAAEVDGATRWEQFWNVTLPMLRPAIVVALIFRTITAIQTFDIPYAMTKGGPGNSTETLAMLIHKTTIDFLDFGYGSAQAVILFIISMVATSFYLRHTRRKEDSANG
jgi:multiple sugar transport system permease protein